MTKIGATRYPGFNEGVTWKDENFDALAATVPGNNNLPTPIIRPGTGIPHAGFPSNAVAEVPFHKEYNHDAIIVPKASFIGAATPPQIRPHIHFSPTTADAGDVKWFFEYYIHFGDESISGTLSKVATLSGVPWQEQRVEIGVIEFPVALYGVTGVQIGGLFYRDPTGDIEDTYPESVVITDSVGWHYPVDSSGSIDVFNKYAS